MINRIYMIVTKKGDVYWVQDPSEINPSFGTVAKVIQYDLINSLDVTSQCNGDYML